MVYWSVRVHPRQRSHFLVNLRTTDSKMRSGQLETSARRWLFVLVLTALHFEARAYFGLTGKNQIRDVKDIDQEAIFIAGDAEPELYTWNENGYYTAPSNGYEKIDMSPKPDADSQPTRGQRLKKNAGSRRPNTQKSSEPEMTDSIAQPDKESELENTPGQLPPKAPASHQKYPHTGPAGSFQRYPRHPYARRPYQFAPRMYRYGRDNIRVMGSPYAPGAPAPNRPILRIYTRPHPRQAISRPIHTVNIDGVVDQNYKGFYSRLGRRRMGAPYQSTSGSVQQRPISGGSSRTGDDTSAKGSKRHSGLLPESSSSRSKTGRKRHLNGKNAPTTLKIQSMLSRQGLLPKAGRGSEKRPSTNLTKQGEISPSPALDMETTADGTEIKPLFVLDQELPSITTFTGIDEDGNAYLGVNGGLDPSDFSPSLGGSDSGSRVTDLPPMVPSGEINKKKARKHCDEIKLTKKQRKLCRRDPGMPQVLEEATAMSAAECQYQFRFERWNCSTGTTRIHLLSKGNRETAFLFAISSAGLTHSVARACAEGHLERCSCEETFSDNLNQEAWRWGGCGDNVQFAAKFVRQFLKSKSQSRDIRAEVDKHNSDIGIRVVRQSVQQTCKCHGVSGSCTTKTCWRKVAPFYDIGRKIKRAYNRSIKVGSINSANGRPKLIRLRRSRRNRPDLQPDTAVSGTSRKTLSGPDAPPRDGVRSVHGPTTNRSVTANELEDLSLRQKPREDSHSQENPRHNELVYLENSPAYCRRTRYSLGTKGRICDKDENCKKICCGRGYTTHVRIVRRSCECEVKWCCYVKCKTCTERKKIYTCK